MGSSLLKFQKRSRTRSRVQGESKASSASRDTPSVLIVDDMPEVVSLFQRWLAAEGYDILTAENGKRALSAVSEEHPSLMLLDLAMPGLNGFQVLQALKEQRALDEMPVVVVTGLQHPENVRQSFQLGASRVLLKPVKLEELSETIREVLRKRA